ncbi:hypothetical protein XANCAGTX0491_006997 [Xanthoria calcicola]
MPRPKRTKLAPSVPIIPAAIASRKPQARPDASPAVSSSRGTNGSDDSEGVVTKSKTSVNRGGIAPQPVFMSGALAVEDVGPQRPRPVSSGQRAELSRIARAGDYSKSHEVLDKRGNHSDAARRPAETAQDAEPQMSKAKPPSQKIAPIRIANTQATPLGEKSVLALDNFKRRPRQPSILQIAQAHNATAQSEGDDTLDDFNPDDESTPIQDFRSILQQQLSSTSSRQSLPRKRKLSTPEIQVPASQVQDPPDPSSSPPPSQPDDLFDIIAEDSQPNPPLPKIPTRTSPQTKPIDSDTMAPPQSSSLPASPQKPQRNGLPKPRNKKAPLPSKPKPGTTSGTLPKESHPILPPRSPSPTQSSPTTAPPLRSPLKPLTTSALQNLLPRRRRPLASSTNKENTVFDLHTSSDIETPTTTDKDEDELNSRFPTKAVRKHRPEKTTKKKKSGAKVKGGGKKGKLDGSSTGGTKKRGQGAAPAAKNKGVAHQRQSMTYTRKRTQNTIQDGAENEVLDSDDDYDEENGGDEHRIGGRGALMDGKARQEMKKLAAKFREVDDWGLEFEEVTGSSDRMRDAR